MSCEQNDSFYDFLEDRAYEDALTLYGENHTEEQFEEVYEGLINKYM